MNAYIIFPAPPWEPETESPAGLANIAIGVIRRIVPTANPDFESLYKRVSTWHIEVDAPTGEPLREVGLDSDGRVVVIGPWHDYYGLIVDCNGTFDPTTYEQLSAEQFEKEWNSFDATQIG